MNVFLSYPVWFMILCPMAGVVFSAILYFRNSHQFQDAKIQHYSLAGLRFLYVTLLVFLLFGPYVKSIQTKLEKPGILLLLDNSESIKNVASAVDTSLLRRKILEIKSELSKKFNVYERSFGESFHEEMTYDYLDKTTNISESLDEAFERYAESNLASIVLVSDGIYNRGVDPIYSKAVGSFPIYTIGVGDTLPRLDLRINNVFYNELVYLGDRFVVKVDVKSFGGKGSNSQIQLSQIPEAGREISLFNKGIQVLGNNELLSEEFTIEAKVPGVNHFKVRVNSIPGEVNLKNNVFDFYVEVLDARQKVLLLSDGAHPDLGALKSSLESSEKYEVDLVQDPKMLNSSKTYSLVILQNLPSSANLISEQLLKWKQAGIPILYLVGSKTSLPDFNKAQTAVQIVSKGRSSETESRVFWNKEFISISLSEGAIDVLKQFPPIQVPFADYKLAPDTKVMMFQKVGMVETNNPILLSQSSAQQSVMVFVGDGIWRWRIHEFMQGGEHKVFDELVSSVAQLASAKADKRKFRSKPRKSLFDENERIFFDAELYDDVYKAVLKAEVTAVIKSQDGKEYRFVFTPVAGTNSYVLNAGFLPVSSYSYSVSTNWNGVSYKETGKFAVASVKMEYLETTADFNMLKRLSVATGAKFFGINQENALIEELSNRQDHKPIIRTEEETRPFIQLTWMFFVILLILTTEWILRKYWGVS